MPCRQSSPRGRSPHVGDIALGWKWLTHDQGFQHAAWGEGLRFGLELLALLPADIRRALLGLLILGQLAAAAPGQRLDGGRQEENRDEEHRNLHCADTVSAHGQGGGAGSDACSFVS